MWCDYIRSGGSNDEARCVLRLHVGHFRLMLERKSLSLVRALQTLGSEN